MQEWPEQSLALAKVAQGLLVDTHWPPRFMHFFGVFGQACREGAGKGNLFTGFRNSSIKASVEKEEEGISKTL